MAWTHSLVLSDFPQLESVGSLFSGSNLSLICPPDAGYSYCVIDKRKQHCTYYWPLHSDSLDYLFKQCSIYNFDTDAPSWSRLSKHLFRTFVTDKKSKIRPHPNFLALSRQGFHWHSTVFQNGVFNNCTELDIKAAYATKILSNQSLYMTGPARYADDSGAIERLSELLSFLDKRLRLVLIGWLSSNYLTTYEAHPSKPFHLIRKSFNTCYDGGVFNCIHWSLKQLWNDMQEFAGIAGSDCIRAHTDSLLIDEQISTKRLNALLKLIHARGYEISVKGHGQAILFELNLGILGGRIIGPVKSALPLFDDYVRAVGPAAFALPDLDKRLAHLPYKNERLSVKQGRKMLGYSQQQLADLMSVRSW